MRERWETRTLSEICTFSNGLWKGKKPPYVNVGVIRNTNFLKDGLLDDSKIAFLDVEEKQFAKRSLSFGDIILEKSGGGPKQAVGRVVFFDKVSGDYSFSNFTAAIRVDDENILDSLYLHKFLHWLYVSGVTKRMQSHSTGIRNLNLNAYKAIEIPLPPLAEQKRIVGVLDEAFAAIGVAVANAQKNLANARELFETTLNNIFTQKGELVELSELATDITDGDHSPPPKCETGIPFVTISNINKNTNELDFSHTFKVPNQYFNSLKANKKPKIGDVLYTVTGSFGIPVLIKEERKFCFQRHIGLIRPKSSVFDKWLYYLLMSPTVFRQANDGATGTAQKTVSLKVLRGLKVPLVPRDKQESIAALLDGISVETQRLEAIYEQKLDDLAELKQSILQKAFAGELTAGNVVAFPIVSREDKPVDTTSPAFAANVIACGYARHAANRRDLSFRRVKAQKLLHLVESMGVANMERQPLKYAAGPNDSAHMRRAENWAKQQQFFEFILRPGDKGYDFKKLARYDVMKAKAFAMMKPYRDRLNGIIDLFLYKNKVEAEVFATVHAAWNNLIIDDVEITDEAILYEARENWHRDKLDIPISKFKTALGEIKQKNLAPDGSAKYVGKQQGVCFEF